ncbi:diheme cytochrome c-553 [Salegentibacter maritimus]|uniref:Diheme cytochrome c-553 n=2 Tax=Salegentibacter maritimus TaxID=2794347 RepID=A0ABS0TEF5_9FLAO|nr:diheme cytochrome c-553 [Salegentibacter maritimus]MBI6119393.1 diheme cytochrome c-553 [Salegentibacter maritimus]
MKLLQSISGKPLLKLCLFSVSILTIILFGSCKEEKKENFTKGISLNTIEEKKSSTTEYENRGKYLVEIIGCHDCHSPKKLGERGPEMITELAFSGFQANNNLPSLNKQALEEGWMLMNQDLTAFVGPWGVSYAANLTPHDTGMGTWTFQQFKRAMVEGKYKGQENARMLLPPMPWQNFKDIKEEDLKAMYFYFKSLPPVANVVPPAKPLKDL